LNIITTKAQLDEMVAYYLKQDAFAFDVETVGDNRGTPAVNEVLWISFATHGRGDVIPMGHPHGEFVSESFPLTGQGEKRAAEGLPARELDYSRDKKKAIKVFDGAPVQLFPAEVFKALKPLLFNDSKLTIGHNLVFDLSSVAKYYGGEVPIGPYFDTLMASFLYDNKNKGRLGLDDCLQRELGYSMEKGIGHQVELYSFNEVAKYSYLDAKYTFLLWKTLVPKLTAADVDTVMQLEMDVLRVLCDMKLTGAPIDTAELQVLYDKLIIEIEEVKSNIYRIAGQPFNINSNNEKQYILYGPRAEGCRGLRPQLLTGKGSQKEESALDYKDYSVSAEALEPYREPLIWGVTPVKRCVGCGSRFNERRGLRGRRIGRGEFCTPECKRELAGNEHQKLQARRMLYRATVRMKSSRQKLRKTPLVAGPCCVCGELLIARQLTKHALHCEGCVTEAQQAVISACRDRRKARKRGAFKTTRVHRRKVFERDKWRCHICGGRIDKSLTSPDRGSATLDHIVPLAFGGEHTMHNIKAAHYGCNSRRGHRAEFQTVLAVAA
jgi:5-methylcytosine-specific restriction endonuclease McrA